jgi:hypothetical protein
MSALGEDRGKQAINVFDLIERRDDDRHEHGTGLAAWLVRSFQRVPEGTPSR